MHLRGVGDEKQGQLAVFLDIVLITVMMHSSGGVQSGLGMLIAVSIALGSLSLVGHTSLLFAALASLAVLTERIYSHITGAFSGTAYTQARPARGLVLCTRPARASPRPARRERTARPPARSDLANLAQLNDFVIQQMRAGILVIDQQETIQVMNETGWVLLGMPVAMRHFPLAEASPPLAQQFRQWFRDPAQSRPDFRATSGGRDLRASFTPIGTSDRPGTLIVLEDTAQLTAGRSSSALASLGPVDAGIAHEITTHSGRSARLKVTRRITGPAGHRPAHDRDHPAQLASRERGGGEHPQAVAPAPTPSRSNCHRGCTSRSKTSGRHRLGEEQLQQQIRPEAPRCSPTGTVASGNRRCATTRCGISIGPGPTSISAWSAA